MSRIYKFLYGFYERRNIMRAEKRDKRAKARRERLEAHQEKIKVIEDQLRQAEMNEIGYMRCGTCRYYTSPKQLLEDISKVAQQTATLKKFNTSQINDLHKLINSPGKRLEASDFEKYKEVFFYLDIKCRNCSHCINANKHVTEGPLFYHPKNIILLQELRDKMVYHNIPVIKYENLCCN